MKDQLVYHEENAIRKALLKDHLLSVPAVDRIMSLVEVLADRHSQILLEEERSNHARELERSYSEGWDSGYYSGAADRERE